MPPSSLAVPATLHASLLGRLDRLGLAAKNVAQVGAAIGRDFSYELLAAAAPLAEPELQEALRRLVEAGLVFQRGAPPAAEYLFKHALVQDTAYSTLLRGPRQPASPDRRGVGTVSRSSSRASRSWRRATTAKLGFQTARCRIGQRRPTALPGTMPLLKRSKH